MSRQALPSKRRSDNQREHKCGVREDLHANERRCKDVKIYLPLRLPRRHGFSPTTRLRLDARQSQTHRIPGRCSEGKTEQSDGHQQNPEHTIYTEKSAPLRCRPELSGPDQRSRLDAYKEHRVGDLVFTHPTAENYHSGFSRGTCEFVQTTDVLYKVDDEPGRTERVEIQHVSQRTIGECRAEHRDIILDLRA